jgi:hypothetical protein
MKSKNSAAGWFYGTSFVAGARQPEPVKSAGCAACARRLSACYRCADKAAGK